MGRTLWPFVQYILYKTPTDLKTCCVKRSSLLESNNKNKISISNRIKLLAGKVAQNARWQYYLSEGEGDKKKIASLCKKKKLLPGFHLSPPPPQPLYKIYHENRYSHCLSTERKVIRRTLWKRFNREKAFWNNSKMLSSSIDRFSRIRIPSAVATFEVTTRLFATGRKMPTHQT